MGRLDDAFRRAAGEGEKRPTSQPSADEDRWVVSGDTTALAEHPSLDELASEPFPDEVIHGALPLRKSAGQAAVAVFDRSEAAEGSTAAQALASGSLFERMDARVAGKVVVDGNMLPGSREQYRRLAAALHHAQAATGLKVVMIASAAPGEGKTLTSSNLALTLSESYNRSVLLIDADLRRPSLHTVFNVDGAPGLSEGLQFADDRKITVRQVSPNLMILPAGQPTSDPMAGLTSPRMRQLIDEARSQFGWVIIDTPPVGLLTDANLLAAMADGAVMVVRAGETPYDLVQRALVAIGQQKILGVVLNGARAAARTHGYDYYKSSRTVALPPDGRR